MPQLVVEDPPPTRASAAKLRAKERLLVQSQGQADAATKTAAHEAAATRAGERASDAAQAAEDAAVEAAAAAEAAKQAPDGPTAARAAKEASAVAASAQGQAMLAIKAAEEAAEAARSAEAEAEAEEELAGLVQEASAAASAAEEEAAAAIKAAEEAETASSSASQAAVAWMKPTNTKPVAVEPAKGATAVSTLRSAAAKKRAAAAAKKEAVLIEAETNRIAAKTAAMEAEAVAEQTTLSQKAKFKEKQLLKASRVAKGVRALRTVFSQLLMGCCQTALELWINNFGEVACLLLCVPLASLSYCWLPLRFSLTCVDPSLVSLTAVVFLSSLLRPNCLRIPSRDCECTSQTVFIHRT